MPELIVDWDELRDAVESPPDFFAFLHLTTGEVDWCGDSFSDLEGDPDEYDADPNYACVPKLDTDEAYDLMRQFIRTVEDPRRAAKLQDAIEGRGAFRRFRQALYDTEWESWDAFRQEQIDRILVEWLAEHDIQVRLKPGPSSG